MQAEPSRGLADIPSTLMQDVLDVLPLMRSKSFPRAESKRLALR